MLNGHLPELKKTVNIHSQFHCNATCVKREGKNLHKT